MFCGSVGAIFQKHSPVNSQKLTFVARDPRLIIAGEQRQGHKNEEHARRIAPNFLALKGVEFLQGPIHIAPFHLKRVAREICIDRATDRRGGNL